MKKVLNSCNLYTLLWAVFNLKGWLYQADIVSLIVYAIFMLMSAYYVYMVIKCHSNNQVVRAFNILLVMFTIYGLVNIIFFDDVHNMGHTIPTDFYLQNILRSLLPFYAYFYFSIRGYLSKKWLCIVGALLLLLTIPRFYVQEQHMMDIMFAKGQEVDEVTNNGGYFFTALLPILCFWNKKPVIQYICFGVCAFFIITAMKRGAILVGALSLLFYFYYALKNFSAKQKLLTLALVSLFGLACAYYVQDMMLNSSYFEKRVSDTMEGDVSSRSMLYTDFGRMFLHDNNIVTLLVGNGADATIRKGVNYAHNDWLEIAMNQGVLGLCLFFLFWRRLYLFVRSTRKIPVLYMAVGVCFVQMLSKTIFSMSINNIEFYVMIVLGFAVAAMDRPSLCNELM